MLKLRELTNAIFMYVYLQYHIYKIRTDFKYMVKECLDARQDVR